jgi:hypothetical protein
MMCMALSYLLLATRQAYLVFCWLQVKRQQQGGHCLITPNTTSIHHATCTDIE